MGYYSRRIAGDIFRNAEDFVLKSHKRFLRFRRALVASIQTKEITETLGGRSNSLLSSDAFNQSGKGVDAVILSSVVVLK